MASRIHSEIFPASDPPDLFKVRKRTPLYAEASSHAFTQLCPQYPTINREDSLLHLLSITTDPNPTSFLQRASTEIDVDCFIDFILLANFTGNEDGIVNNTIVARHSAPPHRFFFIPWDYDKTFRPGQPTGWLSNHLDRRLHASDPTYESRKAARWNSLRQTLLSDEALRNRISLYQRTLDGYLPFEYELLNYPPESSDFELHCRTLLHEALRRAHALDAHFAQDL